MEDPGQLPRLIAGPAAEFELDLALDLALDELFVSRAEALARVWSPPGRAAVIGVGSKAAAELDLEACRAEGLPVLRRMSGGAAVLLAPEVACFSLVFPHALFPDAKKISGAYA
ncbi:MAG: lipoyl protein ligase domain-containing protein, partial [Planctomycetota bacterium]